MGFISASSCRLEVLTVFGVVLQLEVVRGGALRGGAWVRNFAVVLGFADTSGCRRVLQWVKMWLPVVGCCEWWLAVVAGGCGRCLIVK
uniref:Secreted protein n=1 Tax=Fagus sylvatica TaxID=28930 RepID=A0A2N9FI75_FAGSY